ncbi:MAG TPA: exopolyphosphatase [Azospirillaceae bacterium]|nr:exopolyphosphatase [Azospirillaceae bacterium]
MTQQKFRLVTRSDMDGLVCAVLLKELYLVDDILFVHPKDMQDGKIAIGPNDITCNLPYVPGCHLAFDHHLSEMYRVDLYKNHIIDPEAPSAARVVYDYYGGRQRFPTIPDSLMQAVDKADSAQFTQAEVLDPQGWVLLSFLMDARTGLGRWRDFRVSNYELMMKLIDWCRTHSDADEILELPDVKERVELYREHQAPFREQLERCTTVHKNLAVVDLRDEDPIYCGNRFVVYALHPECNLSMHCMWGRNKANTVFAIGKSIINRSSIHNVGQLCLEYGGGGHEAAGTCQVDNDRAETVRKELVGHLTA